MAWGRTASPKQKSQTKLERRAAKAEKAFLSMPEEDQRATLAAVDVIARAVTSLKNVPDTLVDELGHVVVDFLLELKMPAMRKPTVNDLVKQILDGAPTLLGPHRARIEEAIGAAAAE